MGGARQQPAAIRPFFEQLGERCQQIEAVAMDMNTAFDLEVKQHCPQAEVVYDLFPRGGSLWPRGGGPGASGTGECTEKAINRRESGQSARWLLLRNRAKLVKNRM